MRQLKHASKASSAAGKVVLAAIVHHLDETINQELHDEEQSESNDKRSGKKASLKSKEVECKSSKSKFSRLFNRHKQQSATAIENKLDSKLKVKQEAQESDEMNERQMFAKANVDREQVIEFKFDLIVERLKETAPAFNFCQKCKLNDNINELLESFVLDSNDVCLISTGANQEQVNLNNGSSVAEQRSRRTIEVLDDEFEYIFELAAHSLVYSFQQLDSRSRDNFQLTSDTDELKKSSLQANRCKEEFETVGNKCFGNYSIELSATLFQASTSSKPIRRKKSADSGAITDQDDYDESSTLTPTHQRLDYAIVDLLADDDERLFREQKQNVDTLPGGCDDENEKYKNEQKFAPISIDCLNVSEALETLNGTRQRLNAFKSSTNNPSNRNRKLLIIGLKLKQRINGGVFSNRLSLINFDPNFVQLNTIFESIFNGQALSYLKRQKFYLEALESEANSSNKDNFHPKKRFEAEDFDDKLDFNNKQHHQVASLNKLTQAEWLLYKQLSSALIRTLMIVHVHKLSTSNESSTQANNNHFQQRLMAENLRLLEFARDIKRASMVRLKRRKRHLKSHLASSNVSIASNASANTTAALNLFASPIHSLKHTNEQAYQASQGGHRARKASMDMNLALLRHHRRHRSSCQQESFTGKFYNQPDLTESSSLSTSSGSQRTRQVCSNRSASSNRRHFYEQENVFNNLSDTDSVTSANLNSCSSSSFNRLPSTATSNSLRHHQCNNKSKNRRDVELRWISKQSKRIMSSRNRSSSPIEMTSMNVLNQTNTLMQQQQQQRSSSRVQMLRESSANSVIQIDCPPHNFLMTQQIGSNVSAMQTDTDQDLLTATTIEDNTDNVSDICSVVAEPPKQLKLEEFLNQLSNIIAPTATEQHSDQFATISVGDKMAAIKVKAKPAEASITAPVAESLAVDEDDEDCKSHSSILEHLSSLAIESNTRLNNRINVHHNPHPKTTTFTPNQLKTNPTNEPGLLEMVQQATNPSTGHLQRLLNTSTQLQRKNARVILNDSTTLEDQLRELTISCQAQTSGSPQTPSSSVLSNESSCSSSLSSADKKADIMQSANMTSPRHQQNLYASVCRN